MVVACSVVLAMEAISSATAMALKLTLAATSRSPAGERPGVSAVPPRSGTAYMPIPIMIAAWIRLTRK